MQPTQKMLVKKSHQNITLTLMALLCLIPLSSCTWTYNCSFADEFQMKSQDGTKNEKGSDYLRTTQYEAKFQYDLQNSFITLTPPNLKMKQHVWLTKTDGENNIWMHSRNTNTRSPSFIMYVDRSKTEASLILNGKQFGFDFLKPALIKADIEPKNKGSLFMSAFKMDQELFDNFPVYLEFMNSEVNTTFNSENIPLFNELNKNASTVSRNIHEFYRIRIFTIIFTEINNAFGLTDKKINRNSSQLKKIFDGILNEEIKIKDGIEVCISQMIQVFLNKWFEYVKQKFRNNTGYKSFLLTMQPFGDFFKKNIPSGLIPNEALANIIYKEIYSQAQDFAVDSLFDEFLFPGDPETSVFNSMIKTQFGPKEIISLYDAMTESQSGIDPEDEKLKKLTRSIRKAIINVYMLVFEEFETMEMGNKPKEMFLEYVTNVQTKWTGSQEYWNESGINLEFFKQLYQVRNGSFDKISEPGVEQVALLSLNAFSYAYRILV
jgi:hypothetical protein